MKRVAAAIGITVATLTLAPQVAHAGLIRFATVSCSTGISLAWADAHDTDGNLNNPPTDVYTMVIESATANGVPVGVHTIDGVNAVLDPITATGVVTIVVRVHWHIERPNGTSTDSPSVPRSGTVTCNPAPPTTAPPTTAPPTTAPATTAPATTSPATTTPPVTTVAPTTVVAQTTSSVASGGVTVPTTVAPATTRVSTDIKLPETGSPTGGTTVLATTFLVVGAAAYAASRRRRTA